MAKDTATKPPNGPPCPKCGAHKDWNGPSYQKGKTVKVRRAARPHLFREEDIETEESLEYRCTVCGYIRHEPCRDNG